MNFLFICKRRSSPTSSFFPRNAPLNSYAIIKRQFTLQKSFASLLPLQYRILSVYSLAFWIDEIFVVIKILKLLRSCHYYYCYCCYYYCYCCFIVIIVVIIVIVVIFIAIVIAVTGPSEAGGLGGFSPPNNLLKFVDFETEKGCKSQGRRNKYSNSYIFEKALRIYQNAISFDVIEVKDFKIFRERLSLVVIFSSVISKNGAFSSDLKGLVMKNFSGGKPPDPHLFSLRSHLVSAPPI